ncbi:MAG: hypothetical protein ACM3N4_13705, partial [Nitrososphaerota archaeon]
YAVTDTYTMFAASLHGTLWQQDQLSIVGGRPLQALFNDVAFGQLHSYQELRVLSIVAILGIVLLAWVLLQTLLFAGISRIPATIIPVLICVAPAFQVYAAWTVCAYYPYTAAVAGIALVAVEQGYRASSLMRKLALSAIGLVLLLLALLAYQPDAMMYWVFAAIFILTGYADLRAIWTRFAHYSVIAVAGFIGSYIAIKIGQSIVGSGVPTRSSLATDPFAKLQWFIGRIMLDALNLYNVNPALKVALAVAVLAGIGTVLYMDGSWQEKASKGAIAILLAPLCYLPNLLVAEYSPSYRSEVAITALVILYLSFGLVSLYKLYIPAATVSAYGVMLALALAGGISAARNVTVDFAYPQNQELELMRSQLSSPRLATATSVYLIPATAQDAFAPDVRYDEYGIVSSSVWWSQKPMVYLLLREIAPSRADIPVTVAPASGPFNPPPGSLVVDMRLVKHLGNVSPGFG